MDINMPGVDGFEVMAYFRRYPNLEDVPVVFITTDDQPETAQRAREMGALLLIIKPVSLEALKDTLIKAGLR
jgi:CheY-like chemotaxis protein